VAASLPKGEPPLICSFFLPCLRFSVGGSFSLGRTLIGNTEQPPSSPDATPPLSARQKRPPPPITPSLAEILFFFFILYPFLSKFLPVIEIRRRIMEFFLFLS